MQQMKIAGSVLEKLQRISRSIPANSQKNRWAIRIFIISHIYFTLQKYAGSKVEKMMKISY